MTHVAIIGAGLAGLSVASSLPTDIDITLYDKARGLGGRLSTRRTNESTFDHGAQFMTVRTKAFQTFLSPMIQAGYVAPWQPRLCDILEDNTKKYWQWPSSDVHYVGVPGMNQILKYLGRSFDIRLNQKITSIKKENQQWVLYNDTGESLDTYDWVILATPSPQAVQLLPKTHHWHAWITSREMHPCFSLMLGFSNTRSYSFDALRLATGPLNWIALNHTKPERQGTSVVAHTRDSWAITHQDAKLESIESLLEKEVRKYLEYSSQDVVYQALHAWRYAYIRQPSEFKSRLDTQAQIGVCGDWCIESRVESAFISGYDLAQTLTQHLRR